MSAFPPDQYPPAPAPAPRRGRLIAGIVAGSLAALLIGGTVTGVEAAAFLGATSAASKPPAANAPTTSTAGVGAVPATDDQQVGVVTITTDVYYGEGRAAGTGMILTSDGEILTNNHVVEGSTTVDVVVESTGRSYTATVVGTDPTDDIAVLQLDDASGLTPVHIAKDAAALGDAVTSVGNAEGTGDLVAASGTVTAVRESITVADDLTGKPKQLVNLIETDADVVSGDSGGPLVDADDQAAGIVTAASSGEADITGYAIPISTALAVAEQIVAGDESGNVSLGLPPFLGVTIDDASNAAGAGAVVANVIDGEPAALAGLVAGHTITSLDGTPVTDYASLTAVLDTHEPGDTVTLGYTDAGGAAATVTVTLVGGPAE